MAAVVAGDFLVLCRLEERTFGPTRQMPIISFKSFKFDKQIGEQRLASRWRKDFPDQQISRRENREIR